MLDEINALKKRLQRQQQADQDALRSRNQESTAARDARTAYEQMRAEVQRRREQEEESRVRITDPSRAAGNYDLPLPRRFRQSAPAEQASQPEPQPEPQPEQPRQTRVTRQIRSTTPQREPSPTAPSPREPAAPAPRQRRPEPAQDAGLYENFDGMGRLGAALKATQDDILQERGVKRSAASTRDDGTRGTGPVSDGSLYSGQLERIRREEERRRRRLAARSSERAEGS